MIGETVNRTGGQSLHHRDGGRQAGILVDDVKDFVHWSARCFGLRPAGELFGERVEQGHLPLSVSGDNCVADGVDGDGELFLANLEGQVGYLKLFVGLFLNIKQVPAFGFGLFAGRIVGTD